MLFTAVEPALVDFRNVPALSNRLAPAPALSDAAFWTSNNAPARLVTTAPEFTAKLPAPVHTTVPPFSNVRLTSDAWFRLGTARLSVAFASIIVRPLPLIVPVIQFMEVATVSVPVTLKVPTAKSRLSTVRSAFRVSVLLLIL